MQQKRLPAILLAAGFGLAQLAAAQQPTTDINAGYVDPNLDVDVWVERLESEGRDAFDFRREIIAAMKLEPGQAVADIGAGTGLFEPLLAAAVGPEGKVYAVDIAPRFIEHIEERVAERGLTQVEAVLSAEDSIRLAPGTVDVMFVCDTYHHFEDYEAMLASMHAALRPGGKLFVVDFERSEGESEQFVLEHVRADKEQFTKEIEAGGFAFVEELTPEGMQRSYMLQFRKR